MDIINRNNYQIFINNVASYSSQLGVGGKCDVMINYSLLATLAKARRIVEIDIDNSSMRPTLRAI